MPVAYCTGAKNSVISHRLLNDHNIIINVKDNLFCHGTWEALHKLYRTPLPLTFDSDHIGYLYLVILLNLIAIQMDFILNVNHFSKSCT